MIVDGLRVCYLSRFFEEVSVFFTEGFVKGIKEAVMLSASSEIASLRSMQRREDHLKHMGEVKWKWKVRLSL